MRDLLAMGGHGGFVWGAYAIAAAVLIAILVASVAGMRRAERRLADQSRTPLRRSRPRAGVQT